ncbi:MAG: hypothetical protein RL672_1363 [Actinomycetota bacterium]
MRLSQFNQLMSDEFGAAYAQVILRDLALTEFKDATGAAAIAAGEEPREVWFAICRANGVPKNRWHGFDKKKRSEHKDEN